MIDLPEEVIERLKFFCEANDLGLSQIMSDNVNILVIGYRDRLSANEVALLAAKMLLDGIIQGAWSGLNTQALDAEHKETMQ